MPRAIWAAATYIYETQEGTVRIVKEKGVDFVLLDDIEFYNICLNNTIVPCGQICNSSEPQMSNTQDKIHPWRILMRRKVRWFLFW